MKSKTLFAVLTVCLTFSCSHNSTAPNIALPDLALKGVTYSWTAWGLSDTILVQNIGQGDFYGLIYMAQATEKEYQRSALFGQWALLFCEWDSNSFKPATILSGQSVRLIWDSGFPSDTNIIRFHIGTDTTGRKETIMSLPTYAEASYSNNDYLLTVNR
jgi:hypothetical protein